MPRAKRAPSRDQLQMEVDLIAARPPEPIEPIEEAAPAIDAELPPPAPAPEVAEPYRAPFGAWLVKQVGSSRWYAPLAKVAKSDTRFPTSGDHEAVAKYMQERGGDSEVVEMLEDAERDWLRG